MARHSNLALRDAPAFLEVVAGGEVGQIWDLNQSRLSVGRALENDIVISSESISRQHAIFEQDRDGNWLVKDNQSKNGVQVNGALVPQKRLEPGDLVQIGNLTFRFNDSPPSDSHANFAEETPEQAYFSPPTEKKKPNRRVLIYSVLGLLLAFVYLQNEEPTKKNDEGKTPDGQKMAWDFKEEGKPSLVAAPGEAPKPPLVGIEDQTLKRAEQEMAKLDWSNTSLREAEQYFRKGQREYLNKNLARSIDLFQTALSLYRGHELAEKYLKLATYNAEQEAKRQRVLAVTYFESLQYQRAIFHFNEVIALMAHRPEEPIVAEAEKYITLCRKRLQAAELFP